MLTATYYTAPVLKRHLIHINEPLRIYAYYSRKLTIIAIYDITDISEPYLSSPDGHVGTSQRKTIHYHVTG